MHKKNILLIGSLILLILAAGCGPSAADQTATVQARQAELATSTPVPTDPPTPTATATVTPTASPSPSPTPTATQTVEPPGAPVTEFVDGMQITLYDDFDPFVDERWRLVSDRVTVTDGLVQMDGKIYRDTQLILREEIREGEGVIFDFQFTPLSEISAFFDYSLWIKNDYKRFGVDTGKDTRINMRSGIEALPDEYLLGNLTPVADTWYSMLIAVDEDAEFLVLIWSLEEPDRRIRYFGNFKETWEDLPWTFQVNINDGTVFIEDFRKFTFEDLNYR